MLGNTSKYEVTSATQEYGNLLGPGEEFQNAYKLSPDALLFTNYRLILVDKQGITGKKIEYMTIPYKSVVRFSVESASHFDLDAVLMIWTSGLTNPIQRHFSNSDYIYEVQALLASYVGQA